MNTELIVDLLIGAAGIALSPFPVIAITLVLGSDNARVKGLSYTLGWLLGLGLLVSLVFWLLLNLELLGNQQYETTNWVRVGLGIMLLLLAIKKWVARSKKPETEAVPSWIATVDTLSTKKTFALGATMGGINPKNFAFSILFLSVLIEANISTTNTILLLLLFIFTSSLVILGSVGYYLLATTSATKRLQQIKTFMIVQNDTIMMVMFVIFGLLLINKGIV